jgi:hypothetical protein
MRLLRRLTLPGGGRGVWIVIAPGREPYRVPAPHPARWRERAQQLIGADVVSGVPLDGDTNIVAGDRFLSRPHDPNPTARAVAALYGQHMARGINGTAVLTGHRIRRGRPWQTAGLRGRALARARRLVALAAGCQKVARP